MVYANPWDWVSPINSSILFIIGIIIFPACFLLQQYWWSHSKSGKTIIKTYQLTEKDTIDISNKIVSAFQAVCAGVSGVLICWHCVEDVLHCRHTMALGYAWFGIPYFTYDTFCMFYVYTFSRRSTTTATPKTTNTNNIIKKDPSSTSISYLLSTKLKYLSSTTKQFLAFVLYSPVIFIHHMIMASVGWVLILFYRDQVETGDFFVGIIYMMECSTPFVSIRFILSKLKMKSSIWYSINGIVMLVTFPIFRILSVVYAALLYGQQNNYPTLLEGIMGTPIFWRMIWIVAVMPQIYWYFLMCKGLVKIYFISKQNKLKNNKLSSKEDGGVAHQDDDDDHDHDGAQIDGVNKSHHIRRISDKVNFNEADDHHSLIKPCCSSSSSSSSSTNLHHPSTMSQEQQQQSSSLNFSNVLNNDQKCFKSLYKNE